MSRRNNLIRKLHNRRYRDAFVSNHISNAIALQIRALRNREGWDQATLGERAGGMRQTAISRLEDPTYGNLSVNTLKRLASAFDVGLIVRFAPFCEIVDWDVNLSSSSLTPPNYENDARLHQAEAVEVNAPDRVSAETSPAIILQAQRANNVVSITEGSRLPAIQPPRPFDTGNSLAYSRAAVGGE